MTINNRFIIYLNRSRIHASIDAISINLKFFSMCKKLDETRAHKAGTGERAEIDGARDSRTKLSLLKSNMCDYKLRFLSFDGEDAMCLKGAG